MSEIEVAGRRHHRRFLPYVSTVHGALMTAGLLKSQRAIETSIFIGRAMVELPESDCGPLGFLTPKGK